MRKPRGYRNHTVAPSGWRQTSNITGDYEMDKSICACKNKSLPGKLDSHLTAHDVYRPQTAYNAYSAYTTTD